jgi:hypothetical protein
MVNFSGQGVFSMAPDFDDIPDFLDSCARPLLSSRPSQTRAAGVSVSCGDPAREEDEIRQARTVCESRRHGSGDGVREVTKDTKGQRTS